MSVLIKKFSFTSLPTIEKHKLYTLPLLYWGVRYINKPFTTLPLILYGAIALFPLGDIFSSNKPYKLEDVKVAFYLCMHTSIAYGNFMKIKKIIFQNL